MINQQFEANCESQKASLVAYKEIVFSLNRRAEKTEDQAQGLIATITVPKKLNFQTRQVCFNKGAPAGKGWHIDTWDGDVWMNAPKNLESTDSPESCNHVEESHSFP